jgi:peptidoglycan/LPS O-acetylase OafA/YrhL
MAALYPLTAPTKFRYIPSLDGVRGIALLLVLLLHGSYGFFKGGWIGVDLFFVLSGYLITSLLQEEYATGGRIALTNFYLRRIRRLLPPLVLCILLTNMLWPLIPQAANASRFLSALASLCYFANLVPDQVIGPLGHTWSLSVEEHFYILWPVITSWILFRVPFRTQVLLILAVVILVAIGRIYLYNLHESFLTDPVGMSYRFTLCRIDSILLGALLALALAKSNATSWKNPRKYSIPFLLLLGVSLVIILLTLDSKSLYWRDGGFIATNLLCVGFVLLAIQQPTNFFLANSVLRWVGRRSYGLYLYHMPLFMAFEGLRVPHNLANFLLITALRLTSTVIVTELSFRFVEQPILRAKKSQQLMPLQGSYPPTIAAPISNVLAKGDEVV